MKKKIAEALHIIEALGLPRAQQNDRSALSLLALLNMIPQKKWAEAESPLMGITPIMDWARKHYKKEYAPNSRETFRRQTMHQFVDACISLYNPDDPKRPVNSPWAVYQIEPSTLSLIKVFGSSKWEPALQIYLSGRETLKDRYAKHRDQQMIPVQIAGGKKIILSPGKHNELIKAIIEEFSERFVPGGRLVYVGDTGEKWVHFDKPLLKSLGVAVDSHGKMPDVVVFCPKRKWLFLAEAVTTHGPVNGKRHEELSHLFSESSAGLVYVTAFPKRSTMARYLADIAWETEVWVSDAPSHLIHFNGDRFLGPHRN